MDIIEIPLSAIKLEYSDTEHNTIVDQLKAPALRQHLKNMVIVSALDLANLPIKDLTNQDVQYLMKHAFLKGMISCANDLLQLEKAPTQDTQPKS